MDSQKTQIINSSQSAPIKRARALYQKKQRTLQSLAVVEGQNPVEVLVNKFPGLVTELFVDSKLTSSEGAVSKWDERTVQIYRTALTNPQIKVHLVQRKILDELSIDAKGVLALAKTGNESESSDEVFANDNLNDLIVICKEVSDPGNAGAILRASAAFGVKKVIFAGDSVDRWNPKVVRASVGAAFQIPIDSSESVEKAIENASKSGFFVIAADGIGTPSKPARALQDALRGLGSRKIAWVFGNEAHGLSDSELELCDAVAKVEISEGVESLNLAGAVHICLYETIIRK